MLDEAALPYLLCQAFSTAGSLKSTVSDPLDDWPDAGPCDGIYTLDNAGETDGEAEPGQGGWQARLLVFALSADRRAAIPGSLPGRPV